MKEMMNSLKEACSAGIICHINPDGDTLGSGLALYHAFHSRNIPAVIFCETPLHTRYQALPGWGVITQNGEEVLKAQTVITVDCADLRRTGLAEELAERHDLLNIDHHESNSGFGFAYITKGVSLSESLLEVLETLQWEITPEIATCLYAGVVTDSGRFTYLGTRPETLEVGARLMRYGADWQRVCQAMFHNESLPRMRLLQLALYGMTFPYDGRVALMTLSIEQMKQAGAEFGDTENFVNFGIDTEQVQVSVFIQEIKPEECKVSLRGKADTRVDGIAKTFGGGGHRLAAGCSLSGTLHEACEIILKEIGKWL
ncbi:MAG: DHH family phosphoesterase [Christensenellales bacterium]|jgi:phosphoesterase RecJ-like protein